MNRHLLTTLAVVLLTAVGMCQNKSTRKNREYKSANGNRVVIVPVGAEGESRVVFFDSSNKRMCTADYASSDGSHGFVVAKAQWTPDQRFFVYSMTSSGGHQPWHAPTEFVDRDNHQLCHLDDFFGSSGVATTDFKLIAPNTVLTALDLEMRPVTTSLDTLLKKNGTTKKTGCVPCNIGGVLIFGDTTPYEHSPN